MLEDLKKEAHAANLLLRQYGLIHLTWGNASVVGRNRGVLVHSHGPFAWGDSGARAPAGRQAGAPTGDRSP